MARRDFLTVNHAHRGSASTSTLTSSSSSTSAAGLGFDASKQGTIPPDSLHAPPGDEPAVIIGFIDDTIGLGVYATRHIRKGEFIIHERPIMTAVFNEMDSDNRGHMRAQGEAVREAQSGAAHLAVDLAFPQLAAGLGHPPCVSDGIRLAEVGTKLVHGGLDPEWHIGREEFLQYIQGIPVADNPSKAQQRSVCRDFFKNYAFQVRASKTPSGATSSLASSKACVYLLGSLINHCCPGSPGPNCEFQVGPGGLAKFVEKDAIAIKACRDIKPGKQLTISYGKQRKGFHCQCKTCERKPPGREQLCVAM